MATIVMTGSRSGLGAIAVQQGHSSVMDIAVYGTRLASAVGNDIAVHGVDL